MANLPEIKRGATYRFTYTHKHNGEAADLTGATVVFTVKSEESDSSVDDSTAVIQKVITEHLEQVDDNLGKTVINCTPSDTLTHKTSGVMIEKGSYTFDIKVFHLDGTAFIEEEGKVKVDTSPTNLVL